MFWAVATVQPQPIPTGFAKWPLLLPKTYFQIIVKNYNRSQCQHRLSAISAIILPSTIVSWKLISLRSTVVKNLTNANCVISHLPNQEIWEIIWESTRGKSHKGAHCVALFALPKVIWNITWRVFTWRKSHSSVTNAFTNVQQKICWISTGQVTRNPGHTHVAIVTKATSSRAISNVTSAIVKG